MYRINQYRPNLRKRYGKVKECQWSNKPTEVGVDYCLSKIEHIGSILNEEITDLSVHTNRDGKIHGIWVSCSKPQYSWDRGFHSFMITYRPRRANLSLSFDERDDEKHENLLNFLKWADEYFKKNGLSVEVRDDDFNETSIEEIISSY